MQVYVVRMFELKFPSMLFYAIPNGEYRTLRGGLRLKAEGVRAGMLDLCVAEPRHGFAGLYIELKMPGRTPPDTQLDTLHKLNARGYVARWCDAAEDAIDLLTRYLSNKLDQ